MRTPFLAILLTGALFAQDLQLVALGTYRTGLIESGGAEITAYHARTRRVYIVNAGGPSVDCIDISNPQSPRFLFTIAIPAGYSPNSVAVNADIIAVAIQAPVKTDNGLVAFYDTDGNILNAVTVGALPDMVTFTPDGKKVLSANEGEPSDDYTVDPIGSVSIINIERGVRNISQADVRTVNFGDRQVVIDPAVRIFGPRASFAQDLEPEYIAVSDDSKTAYVGLQENNAIGVINLETGLPLRVVPLGFKNHNLPGNGLDPSDRDNAVAIANWPVFGMYQPDGIAFFRNARGSFIITANEGDARAYPGFNEETRVGDLRLDPTAFPNGDMLKNPAQLGRLRTTNALGDIDGDGDFDRIYTFGARSFSVWNAETLQQVFDSGDQLERLTANLPIFNMSHNNNIRDDRSDDKGPEPEGLAIGQVGNRSLLFLGHERDSSISVWDLENPAAPRFVTRVDNRIPTGSVAMGTAGDLGPEGLTFIPAADSPTNRALLLVANEISGTLTIWEVR
jgi:hypothetical protein